VSDRWHQQAAFLQLLTLLAGTPRAVREQGLLTDRTADPGLFGPRSVTWRVVREPLLLASGSRALLMQLAHPIVAQAVADHSRLEGDPFGRLLGTVGWVAVVVFGTAMEAGAAVDGLRRVHERIRGTLKPANATPAIAGATPYSALDPTVGLWVHATLVDSLLVSYNALIGRLSADDADRFVLEWHRVAELLGVLPAVPWRGRAGLAAYVGSQIGNGIVFPVPAATRAALVVLAPPLPWPALVPASRTIALLTTGSLDARLRAGYGLEWSPGREALYRLFCAATRRAAVMLPRQLRVSPLYDLARSRLALTEI